MSASSFSTLTSEGDRTESVDSLTNHGAVPSPATSEVFDSSTGAAKVFRTPKTGSFVMCVSMATFYGGEDAAAKDMEDFGEDNPFMKELGMNDKVKMDTRKNAIEEAAAKAKKRQAGGGDGGRKSNLQQALDARKSNLSETQFSPTAVRQEFIKRQDASTKAFTPAILQALAEKKDEHTEPVVVVSKAAPKKKDSKFGFIAKLFGGGGKSSTKKSLKEKNTWKLPVMEERAEW